MATCSAGSALLAGRTARVTFALSSTVANISSGGVELALPPLATLGSFLRSAPLSQRRHAALFGCNARLLSLGPRANLLLVQSANKQGHQKA